VQNNFNWLLKWDTIKLILNGLNVMNKETESNKMKNNMNILFKKLSNTVFLRLWYTMQPKFLKPEKQININYHFNTLLKILKILRLLIILDGFMR
jgi:hypothetical protein